MSEIRGSLHEPRRPSREQPFQDECPSSVADATAVELLLRCYARETGLAVADNGDTMSVELPHTGLTLRVPVRYRSRTGYHRFGVPLLDNGTQADVPLIAAALIRETTADWKAAAHSAGYAVARVLDSRQRVEAHIEYQQAAPEEPAGTSPFLSAEQALLVGHPFHPTPKSRQGASEAELAAYSPEMRGSFPLHWFAADRSVVSRDHAGATDAPDLIASLAPDLRLPRGTAPVPAHPWQAREIANRPGMRALVDSGLLRDLGPAGPEWHATSSLRTVYRADAPFMLKLSLGLRITNSRRNNLRSEMALATAVARLLRAGLGAELRRARPVFRIIPDNGWLAVDPADEAVEGGLETLIRENPFGPNDPVACLAGLVAERPGLGPSQLVALIDGLASRSGRTVGDVAQEWFARYLTVVAEPVLWLYLTYGLALEAHQQNTLVTLDPSGWPIAGWYRDSQGYYVAASRADRLRGWLPGFDSGTPAVFDDALVEERLAYYLGVNNLLGLVGAFGSQDLADEDALLRVLRHHLHTLAHTSRRDSHGIPPLLATLLDAPVLPCKANYLTCVDGRDELAGTVEAQSVYVDIPNPLAEART